MKVRPFRLGMLIGLLLVLCLLPVVGCESGGLRDANAIAAERACLETTVPFAKAYKEKHPAEAQRVDDFYTTWRGRLDKESAAVAQ